MAVKIKVIEDGRVIGAMTLFDMVPSFALIHAVLPDARRVIHNTRDDQWYVDLGEQLPPALAS